MPNRTSQGKDQADQAEPETGDLNVPVAAAPAPLTEAPLSDLQKIGRTARNSPVMSTTGTEVFEPHVPRVDMVMPGTGTLANFRRSDLVLESADPLGFEDHAAALSFLNEMVVINIMESSDPDAENPVFLSVNGVPIYVTRGQDEIVRRKYVEQLLRAKPVKVNSKGARNSEGDAINKITKTTSLRYPFNIVRDDNPKGQAWRKKILAEA